MVFIFKQDTWERSNTKNGYVQDGSKVYCNSQQQQKHRELLHNIQTNGLYHGFSLDFGVEINTLINIKCIFYRNVKKPEIEYSPFSSLHSITD